MTESEKIEEAIKSSQADYIIWYTGSREQAEFIERYSECLCGKSLLLPLSDSAAKGTAPYVQGELLSYFFLDFPDVIISSRIDPMGLPHLGIEILEQKPVGWNHTQRFPRAAASAIRGVPFAYLLPRVRYMFEKLKSENTGKPTHLVGETYYVEERRVEYQLFYALLKLSEIHKVPCLPFEWPISDFNKFLSEGLLYNTDPLLRWKGMPPGPQDEQQCHLEIRDLFSYIDLVLTNRAAGGPVSELMDSQLVMSRMAKIHPDTTTLYTKKHVALKDPDGGNIKIARRIATNVFLRELHTLHGSEYVRKLFESPLMDDFKARDQCVVIDLAGVDPTKDNRGFADPYSGVCAAFDYRYCRDDRNSPEPYDRDANLVLLATHENAAKWWDDRIAGFVSEEVVELVSLESRKTPDDTALLTRSVFDLGPYRLTKDLKNLLYFCDLVVTNTNVFVGQGLVES